MHISSKDNKIYKIVRKLADKKYRDEYGLFVVEGMRAVADVLAYRPDAVDSVLVTASKASAYENAITVDDGLFARLTDTVNSQGILAIVKKPKATPSGSLYALFLDGVRDPGNLGTLIRTACAAGYNDIYLRGCADPYGGKVVRSTMSAIVKVNLLEADASTLSSLKTQGYTVIGADMDGKNIFDYGSPTKLCLIIGGEADGITEEISLQCDDILSVPMNGCIESLNAAVCGGIMMYNLKFNK